MDFDEIRLKEPEELSDEEKGLLKEHQGELSDEEKEAFRDIMEPEEKEEEDQPFKTFKTQEELDTYLDEQRPQQDNKDEEDTDEEKPVDFFPGDYKPKDWNQFANDLLPKLKPVMRAETENFSQETKEKIADINAQFDAEIEQLREIDPSIPASNTPERRDFDKQIAQVALKNKNVRTMTQAYAIFKKENVTPNKETPDDTSDIARKVGGGGKSGDSKPEKKYADVAQMSDEDAWDAALQDLEAGS